MSLLPRVPGNLPQPLTSQPSAPADCDTASPLELCVLGSGSGGNASVVRCGRSVMLIDLGFGPRSLAGRLEAVGLGLEQIQGICLTHLDHDHFRAHICRTLAELGIPLYVHAKHWRSLLARPKVAPMREANLLRRFDGSFEPAPGLRATPVSLAHDATGTFAYRVESAGGSLGYASDLGRVPEALVEAFVGVNLLAIESNYDPQMQRTSGRPMFLQNRIMGGAGHLSNQEAFDAVAQIVQRSPAAPSHVVLLHRSREANCPDLLRRVFESHPVVRRRLTLSEQHTHTPWLTHAGRGAVDAGAAWRAGAQMRLFG